MGYDDETWLSYNKIDAPARKVFSNLDADTRSGVREQGTLWNRDNPSATLMMRIREHGGPGFVPDRIASSGTAKARAKEVVVFLRGEAFRVGRNKEHRPDATTGTLVENLTSVATYLVAPLEERGYTVLVFADIMGDAAREEEARIILVAVFGDSFREARVTEWLRGPDQISSVISSVDSLYHMLKMRKKEVTVVGAYVTRVDTRLLQLGTSDWPLDKLCFPWKTRWGALPRGVNDVLFYIPCALFGEFRAALEKPLAPDNLHWLGECRKWPQRGITEVESERFEKADQQDELEKYQK